MDNASAELNHWTMTSINLRARFTEYAGGAVLGAVRAMTDCFARKGKVLIFGNGGSAAQAQHMAAELVGRFRRERRALPAIALTSDTSILTALANDYGYEQVFARQVEALGQPGDVALGITTSGKSPNVLHAFQAARKIGMQLVALTGSAKMNVAVEWLIAVPSSDTAQVQEMHLAALHWICDLVEAAIVEEMASPPVQLSARKIAGRETSK
jgi:D-sedoheptulose 7-phosphate isomerase